MKPAVVVDRFRACDQIKVDCHSKTQVWIPLKVCLYGWIYKVAICTHYNSSTAINLPKEYVIDRSELEITCRYSKSRATGDLW